MTNDESELTRFRHGERVGQSRQARAIDRLTAERDAAPAAERRRIRSLLAGKIVETRREMRDGWSVPPEYMFDRIEILREIGKAVSK